MNQERDLLARHGPMILAFWGWALLALSVAQGLVGVVAAICGAMAALARARNFTATAVVEGAALCTIIALAPTQQIGFVALGALFVVGARVVAVKFRPRD